MVTMSPLDDLESIKRCLPDTTASTGVVVYKREYPPAHYALRVEGFSLLLSTKVEKYESAIFEAGGYTWSLCLYPNGDKKFNGEGHLSLYLVIEGTDQLPRGWEVNVSFKLFVLDQRRNMYLTIQDEAVRRFHELKKEWGFPHLIPRDTFTDPSNGYLADDSCIFGAEVLVVKPSSSWESLAMIHQDPSVVKHKWVLNPYSKWSRHSCFSSGPISIGGRNWNMRFYPNGNADARGEYCSLFLYLDDIADLPPKRKFYVEFKLRMLDQQPNPKHEEGKMSHWFSRSATSIGCPYFVRLEDLHSPDRAFILKDTVKLELEIHLISEVKVFPGGVSS